MLKVGQLFWKKKNNAPERFLNESKQSTGLLGILKLSFER